VLLVLHIGAGLVKRRQKALAAHQSLWVTQVKENMAVCSLQTKLCFLFWKFDMVRSLLQTMHHFYHGITPITPIIIDSFYLPNKTRRILPKIRALISGRKMKKNSKMKDRLHIHQTRAKQ
jgi:hypothetical protein